MAPFFSLNTHRKMLPFFFFSLFFCFLSDPNFLLRTYVTTRASCERTSPRGQLCSVCFVGACVRSLVLACLCLVFLCWFGTIMKTDIRGIGLPFAFARFAFLLCLLPSFVNLCFSWSSLFFLVLGFLPSNLFFFGSLASCSLGVYLPNYLRLSGWSRSYHAML